MIEYVRKKQLPKSLNYIYNSEWLKKSEHQGAESVGISLYQLMSRAGKSAFYRACWLYPFAQYWLVLVGSGNNGGDGYVVATLAAAAGKTVTVLECNNGRTTLLPAEAQQAKESWLATGGIVYSFCDASWPKKIDIIIDGLLGIGLHEAPLEPYATLIETANRHIAPIISLDIPSGLTADTGNIPGKVIKADHTQTFIALKPGLFTGKARSVVGQLHYDDLGLADWLNEQVPLMIRLTTAILPSWLPLRNPCSHKGDNGKLLIIGGDYGFAGAVRIAGEAALRAGAGLVKILTRKENIPALLDARPELMINSLCDVSISKELEWSDVVIIGPGLGKNLWGQNALKMLKNYDKPMLWDADALNLLANKPKKHNNWIITPHSKEAARLLDVEVNKIEINRLLAVHQLKQLYGGVVVLKGAGTLIAAENNITALIDVGNAGMASGGMGDSLSGIIGGFLAQNLSLYNAACVGCVAHGAAADDIVKIKGIRGILATDLLSILYKFVNF